MAKRTTKLERAERNLKEAAWKLGLLYSGDGLATNPDLARMEARNKLVDAACAYYHQKRKSE